MQLFARRILPISALFVTLSLMNAAPVQASDWARFQVYNRTDKCAYINIQISTAWKTALHNYEHFLLKPNSHQPVTFHEEAWGDVRAQAHVYDTEQCGGPTIAETYDDVKASGAHVSGGWLYPAILQRRANLKYMLYFEKIQR